MFHLSFISSKFDLVGMPFGFSCFGGDLF
uniref:Uncharacterized protein n=1 Tax=Rhizophora mucronata TaxID=61149 RepID=A0A2P2PRI1_RHIMU